jgi:hypothetical protein
MTVLSAPTIRPSPVQLRFAVKLTLPWTTSPHAGLVMGVIVAADADDGVVADDTPAAAGDGVCCVCVCACAIRAVGWIAKPITAARDKIVATMYDIIVRFIQMTARR